MYHYDKTVLSITVDNKLSRKKSEYMKIIILDFNHKFSAQ